MYIALVYATYVYTGCLSIVIQIGRRFVAKPLELERNMFSPFFSGIKSCIKTCFYIQYTVNHFRTVASKRTLIKFFGTFLTSVKVKGG